MKMVTAIAVKNMCYNWKRNLLIGCAVCLASILLFLVPSIGYDAMQLQFGAVRQVYPSWHAAFHNVEAETAEDLQGASHIKTVGRRYDVASVVNEENQIELYYMDEESLKMNLLSMESGSLPSKDDEMVVSEGFLKAMGLRGEIGDRITVSYQLHTEEGLDFKTTGEFKITGFIPATENHIKNKIYLGLVSRTFAEENLQDGRCTLYIQMKTQGESPTVTDVEDAIYETGTAFGINKTDINVNNEFLEANYVDPSVWVGIIGIILIIIVAGVITIYSIYYVSMLQNIQEYGRLKAIGAAKRQIRQIVLIEGMAVAAIAVPAGLVLGSLVLKRALSAIFISASGIEETLTPIINELMSSGQVPLYYVWIYAIAAVTAFVTVYLSLRKPMKIVGRISPVEAIRCQGTANGKEKQRKGCEDIKLSGLVKRTLLGNKQRTIITVCSMAATGILYVAIASVLSSTNSADAADNTRPGEYELRINDEQDKEHPEYSWKEIQKDNPLTEELKAQILDIGGVEEVDEFKSMDVTAPQLDDEKSVAGLSEKYWNEVEDSIVEGKASYQDMELGDKLVLTPFGRTFNPELKVGDYLDIFIVDGDNVVKKRMQITAYANTSNALSQYETFVTSDKAVEKLVQNNSNYYFHIQADKKFDKDVENQLKQLAGDDKRIEYASWQQEYELWTVTYRLTNNLCYGFIIVLGAISIMNLINTMINSIHARKKELGILQAIGLSEKQLIQMLQLESAFYTLGTFLISIGIGLLAGYGVVSHMIRKELMNLTAYHFPFLQTVIFIAVLAAVQILINLAAGKFIKRESLIERIRFSE